MASVGGGDVFPGALRFTQDGEGLYFEILIEEFEEARREFDETQTADGGLTFIPLFDS